MAQLDSASVSGAEGSRFEPWWGRSIKCAPPRNIYIAGRMRPETVPASTAWHAGANKCSMQRGSGPTKLLRDSAVLKGADRGSHPQRDLLPEV